MGAPALREKRFVFAPKACFGSKGASERDYQDLRRRRCKPKSRESPTLEYTAVSQLVKSLRSVDTRCSWVGVGV